MRNAQVKDIRNVQVRLSEDVYKGLERIAKEENTTIADVVRKGIQLYGILRGYRKEGKRLAVIDESRQIVAELIIPGISTLAPSNEEFKVR